MLEAHPVHIEPPALGVVLIHLRAAHLKLQTWGQDSLHSLLHCVFTPVSRAQHTVLLISPRCTVVRAADCLRFIRSILNIKGSENAQIPIMKQNNRLVLEAMCGES